MEIAKNDFAKHAAGSHSAMSIRGSRERIQCSDDGPKFLAHHRQDLIPEALDHRSFLAARPGFHHSPYELQVVVKHRAEWNDGIVIASQQPDLDKPTGWEIAPTVGELFLLMGNHCMMHAGQFSAVRRKLGKPVLF